jgi:hypothetical protein
VCCRVAITLAMLGSVVAPQLAQAEAAASEKVELHVFACEPTFAAELRRIVRLELGGLLDESTAGEVGRHGQLEVRCEPELARVTARDARRAQQTKNDLRFDAFPGDAAPRAVALAAVEALRAVDPTLSARIEAQRTAAVAEARPTRPRPAASAKPIAARRVAVRSRAWTRLVLGPVVRHFPSDPHTTLWGARVELSRRSAIPLDYGFELEGVLHERDVDLGTIDLRLLSTAAWIGWRAGREHWSFTGGVGGRLGVAQLEGSSPDPTVRARQTARAWAGPLAVLRGDAAFGVFSLGLVTEAGWAVAGAEGLSRGTPVVSVRGAWLALSLNPGIRF